MQEVTKPVLKENEVLVRIHAVALNAADHRMIQFHIVPESKILGSDIAGEVVEVGSACRSLKVGDRVAADINSIGAGGLAEFRAVPEDYLVRIPDGISYEDAAALPMAAFTALLAIRDHAEVKPGQKVLVYGASGGVGTYMVQLSRYYGAEVTGVCSSANVEMVKSLGAVRVIDYQREDIRQLKEAFDVVLVANGNRSPRDFQRLLVPGGISVLTGGSISQLAQYFLLGGLFSNGGRRRHLLSAHYKPADLEFIFGLVLQGKVKPVIDHVYPFAETPAAFNHLLDGHARGKIVIKVMNE